MQIDFIGVLVKDFKYFFSNRKSANMFIKGAHRHNENMFLWYFFHNLNN